MKVIGRVGITAIRRQAGRCCLLYSARHYGQSWKERVAKRADASAAEPNEYSMQTSKPSQRVYVWGYAATGALGVPAFLRPPDGKNALVRQDKPYRLKFMDEHSLEVSAVACGFGFTVFAARRDKQTVLLGTGINTDSQIGYQKEGDSALDFLIQPAQMNIPLLNARTASVHSLSCGRAHTAAVTSEGVFTLGNNAYGQCGREIVHGEIYSGSLTVNKLDLQGIKKVVCGQDHTVFLADDGKVYSCGLGADGQTGLGHYNCSTRAMQVRGDIEGEHIVDIETKGDTTLAVSDKGDVFGWGNSEYEQLAAVSKDTQVNIPRRLPFANVGKVARVAAGNTICGLLNDQGQVFVWGYGILGKGPKLEQTPRPQLIPETLFGRNDLNAHEFHAHAKVIRLVCGLNHYAALTDSGTLYTWGKNQSGCLGLHHRLDQFFPFMVAVPAAVKEVLCGADHTVAIARSFI